MTVMEHHPLRAVAYGAAGVCALSVMDATIKHLVETNSVLVVTFLRYVFGGAFALAIWLRAGRPALTFERLKAHGVRGLVIVFSATLFFWSLKVLPLAQAVVITFIAPLLVPIIALFILGERIRRRSIIAGGVGFAGVVIASWGGADFSAEPERLLGAAAAFSAAVTYALSIVLLRGRAGKDGPEVIGLLAAFLPGLLIAGPAIATGAAPPLSDLPALIALGVLAAAGINLLARAYALAEAQKLAPLEYTAIIWASLIGFFFFHEIPHPQVLAGAAIIIASCLWGAGEDKEPLMTPFAPGAAPPPTTNEP
ncbi:MAG: DMT family transporter [Parvularculaceae bacterium]